MKSVGTKLLLAALAIFLGFTAYTYLPTSLQINSSKSDNVCIQVITQAKNIITQEVRSFSDPCHVPFGWQRVQSERIQF